MLTVYYQEKTKLFLTFIANDGRVVNTVLKNYWTNIKICLGYSTHLFVNMSQIFTYYLFKKII